MKREMSGDYRTLAHTRCSVFSSLMNENGAYNKQLFLAVEDFQSPYLKNGIESVGKWTQPCLSFLQGSHLDKSANEAHAEIIVCSRYNEFCIERFI